MNLFKNKPPINFIKKLEVNNILNCFDAHLVFIEGVGSLKTSFNTISDNYYGSMNHIQITLNDTPIFYAHSPGCPTCASLIATGYGIEKANCKELESISAKINSNFVNLTQSIKDITPLLSLLESGLYVIADMLCYPTDGNKNFFWNTPNHYTENPATSMVWLNDSDFDSEFIDGYPLYLFPTQSTSHFNNERVDDYIQLSKSNSHFPRAIAYHYDQYMNFLLDGHHKACAAALMHKPVNTLIIIPLSCRYVSYTDNSEISEYKFSEFMILESEIPQEYRNKTNHKRKSFKPKVEEHNVNNKKWDQIYLDSAKFFPTVAEFAMIKAANPENPSEQQINQWLKSNNSNDRKKLRSLIALWKTKEHKPLKKLSLSCASTKEYSLLKVDAFRALSELKNDKDIENFFIEYLIEDDDPHSLLKIIADSYWDF